MRKSYAQFDAHILYGGRVTLCGKIHNDIAERLRQWGKLSLHSRCYDAVIDITWKENTQNNKGWEEYSYMEVE